MRFFVIFALVSGLALTSTAHAQPSLESLWPNQDGTRWEYGFELIDIMNEINFTSPAFLQLEGTHMTPGGLAQELLAEHDIPARPGTNIPALSPLLMAVWKARPDLRDAIMDRYGDSIKNGTWGPLLLHGGYFMKLADEIQMWQDTWNHPTWIYLQDDISVGAAFVFQLIPELADDIFLHGTIADIAATVETHAGMFTNAVKVNYLIDYGISEARDDTGQLLGYFHSETQGHVHYVPDIGPVFMLEEFIPFVWVDCLDQDCPPEWEQYLGIVVQTQTLSLTQQPVNVTKLSWGSAKSLYW